MIIPLWVKIVALLVLVGSLMGMGYYIKGTMEENKQLKANQAAMLDRINKAEKSISDLDQTFVKRGELQADVRNGIADVTVRVKQEASRDPSTKSYLSTALPAGLRRSIIEAAAGAAPGTPGADPADPDRRVVPIQPRPSQ